MNIKVGLATITFFFTCFAGFAQTGSTSPRDTCMVIQRRFNALEGLPAAEKKQLLIRLSEKDSIDAGKQSFVCDAIWVFDGLMLEGEAHSVDQVSRRLQILRGFNIESIAYLSMESSSEANFFHHTRTGVIVLTTDNNRKKKRALKLLLKPGR